MILQDACDENVIRCGRAAEPCSKTRGRWILAATILASSMAFIDGTVVNVALPALQTSLNATAADVQWVIESYALLLSALLLVGGSLGDHYGRRRVFVVGVVIFAVASGLCGFAGSIHQLIAARAVQGFGAALLVGVEIGLQPAIRLQDRPVVHVMCLVGNDKADGRQQAELRGGAASRHLGNVPARQRHRGAGPRLPRRPVASDHAGRRDERHHDRDPVPHDARLDARRLAA